MVCTLYITKIILHIQYLQGGLFVAKTRRLFCNKLYLTVITRYALPVNMLNKAACQNKTQAQMYLPQKTVLVNGQSHNREKLFSDRKILSDKLEKVLQAYSPTLTLLLSQDGAYLLYNRYHVCTPLKPVVCIKSNIFYFMKSAY